MTLAASPVFSDTRSAHRRSLERAVLLMRERLSDELTLEDMAKAAGMSPFHFNRIFRERVGIPPGQFLSALRLEAAKRLLLVTEAPITDICYEVGYNSPGTFTTRFTQLVGLSPGQLRQLGRAFTTCPGELLALAEPPPPPESGPTISGWVTAHPSVSGMVFLGLFTTPIPQSRPVSCAILPGAGAFRLRVADAADDRPTYLFAAGMARFEEPLDFLRNSGAIRGLGSAGPFTGDGASDVRITLRPPDLLDPPLLVTLPLLIDEKLTERLGLDDAALA